MLDVTGTSDVGWMLQVAQRLDVTGSSDVGWMLPVPQMLDVTGSSDVGWMLQVPQMLDVTGSSDVGWMLQVPQMLDVTGSSDVGCYRSQVHVQSELDIDYKNQKRAMDAESEASLTKANLLSIKALIRVRLTFEVPVDPPANAKPSPELGLKCTFWLWASGRVFPRLQLDRLGDTGPIDSGERTMAPRKGSHNTQPEADNLRLLAAFWKGGVFAPRVRSSGRVIEYEKRDKGADFEGGDEVITV
ncbi:hypothetical protein EGW08_011406 [Elysia chlorotica]|uniref:Uncharacterized protein n=1 Tax=Elysia chlorotica TaxID=188477 RepID=A0A3S1BCJ0_ELYCH|nr:hypothetical protein EGW08_011406 [Elysia chlorotica]